jgi:transcriptional regulator with XRE-family HTH domain
VLNGRPCLAKLDISAQQLQKYETGENSLSFGRAVEVSDLLGISLVELAGISDRDKDRRLITPAAPPPPLAQRWR